MHVSVPRVGLFASFALACSLAILATPQAMAMSGSPARMQSEMRKLWEDHLTYSRNYVISGLAGIKDTGLVAARLMENQSAIGQTLRGAYGSQVGDRFASLLKNHILIAFDIVDAAHGGDVNGITAGQNQWHTNAEEIADLLSSLNPRWKRPMILSTLYRHLDHMAAQIAARMAQNWAADIDAYDQDHDEMLAFADLLATGISHP
ncbi:MAG TPA: hypothetical protein VL588_07920 [Bdellovibrionota bacterium]|jgi:hypothetical protein|nr:hypothetical protein [Bdellovibrionota bacterium]